MSRIRKHHWIIYPPKTISLNSFWKLISFLRSFKKELKPSKRIITVKVLGENIFVEKKDDEIENIFAPLVLEEIREIKIFLLLCKNGENSCETLIHISSGSMFLSVSDIGTDWGPAVISDLMRYLKKSKFVASFLGVRLHGFLKILMYPFLILGSTFFILWHFEKNSSYFVYMLGFLFAGFLLLLNDIYLYFVPTKPYQAITAIEKHKKISIQLVINILTIFSILITIAEKIISIINTIINR